MANSTSSAWIIGVILSIIGVLLVFMTWFEAYVLFQTADYNAFDMAFGSPFQEGGFWEDFDPIGKFCPLIFGVLAIIDAALYYAGRNGKVSALTYLIAVFMMIIPIYVIMCINPDSGTGWRRSAGTANYIGIGIGFILMIITYQQNVKS